MQEKHATMRLVQLKHLLTDCITQDSFGIFIYSLLPLTQHTSQQSPALSLSSSSL